MLILKEEKYNKRIFGYIINGLLMKMGPCTSTLLSSPEPHRHMNSFAFLLLVIFTSMPNVPSPPSKSRAQDSTTHECRVSGVRVIHWQVNERESVSPKAI